MTCSPFDLKDYFFEELNHVEREAVRAHVEACSQCSEELSRLRVTQAALATLADEESPRRIAFVSDRVFEPRWWQRFWQSGPRLGFASAALLAMAILVHAFVHTAQPARPAIAAVAPAAADESRIGAEVVLRLQPAIVAAVAQSEARQAQRTAQLVEATRKEFDFERRADRLSYEETLSLMQKKFNVFYTASADLGVRQ
jgi:anti-sigma factor RsiW